MQMTAEVRINLKGMEHVIAELNKFSGGGAGAGAGAPLDTMLDQWAARYEAFSRRRFVGASRGDGIWPPLKLSTILGRKYKGRGLKKALSGRVRSLDKGLQKVYRSTFRRVKKEMLARGRKPHVAANFARLRAIQAVRLAGGKIATRSAVGAAHAGNVAILRDTGILFSALSIGLPGNLRQRIPSGIRVGIGGPAAHPKGKATIAEIAAFHQRGSPARGLPQRTIIVQPDQGTLTLMRQDAVRAMRRLIREAGGAGGVPGV